jgi:DHA1 family inner membrane transport protein
MTDVQGVNIFAIRLDVILQQRNEAAGASSFNIGAFNLGNALGAWLGGTVIDHGPGLTALPWVAALLPLAAAALALKGLRASRVATATC